MCIFKNFFKYILTFSLFVLLAKCDFSDYKTVDEFLDMIVGNITKSQNYVLPTDNSRLVNVSDDRLYEYGWFDFIVIGSGSAGAVLANRLSEVPTWNVLLLEAGGEENDFSDIPEMNPYLTNSEMNWGYKTTLQNNLVDVSFQPKQMKYPRGKVIGGTSTINGLVYVRGNPEDFDSWQMPGWSYEEVFPYFLKSEDARFEGYEKEYHNEGGYLNVDVISETPGLHAAVVSAFQEQGLPYLDYNGKNQIGIGKSQYNHKYNQRASTSRAFLDPVRNRLNLEISLNSFVTKLLISKMSKTVYGVEFIKNGKRFIVKARKEVLLSAGAVNTPQILMLSGVGPKEHLKELGISLVKDLPVGQNLADHVVYSGIRYRTNHTFYNITYKKQVENFLDNIRPLTGWSTLLGFVKLDNYSSGNRPDFETVISVIAPSYEQYHSNSSYSSSFDCYHDILMVLVLLHPNARGTIKLKSNSPLDMPLIDPNYFGDAEGQDIETYYQSIKFITTLNETETFKKYKAQFYHGPVEPCDSQYVRFEKDWWYCAIIRGSSQGQHTVGTTPMGNSTNDSVVDAKLKVHGVRRLRIADAGVMPTLTSGHTSAAAIMIGEKAADLVKEEYLGVSSKELFKLEKAGNEIEKEWFRGSNKISFRVNDENESLDKKKSNVLQKFLWSEKYAQFLRKNLPDASHTKE